MKSNQITDRTCSNEAENNEAENKENLELLKKNC